MLIDTKKSAHARVHQPSGKDVFWTGGLWKQRQNTCIHRTIPHILRQFETVDDTFHVVENFRIAAGEHPGEHRGTPYSDGDFYKLLEAAMYAQQACPNAELAKKIDAYIELIGRAQQPDGYISTKQIISKRSHSSSGRMSDINDFEVYNFGHLLTAACLHKRLFGKDNFLKIAIKAADYLENMYQKACKSGEVHTAVCPAHYMGLIELYRTTGDVRYLETAKLAINLRDSVQNGTDDNQDRLPLRRHRKIVGHGVRSTYLYAGVADLYLETGEAELLQVLDSCWDNCVNQKLYITGGCGALYTGVSPFGVFFGVEKTHQAFGYEYQLPNITAYNETCASIGNILWNLRMFAIQPDAKYFDLIERTLLNVVLASVSLSGDQYFYENMLRRTKSLDYELMWPLERRDRLSCFCCPPNMARTIMESAEYTYMISEDSIYTGIYGASRAKIQLENGANFTLCQDTDYPYDGAIRFHLEDVRSFEPFTLRLRIPAWCESGKICVENCMKTLDRTASGSYIALKIEQPTAEIELTLDMPVRLTCAHSKVEEDTNQVAVERGPLVYCMESSDVNEPSLDHILLPIDAAFKNEVLKIDGQSLPVLSTEAVKIEYEAYDEHALYQTLHPSAYKKIPIRLIPYNSWDNRGWGEMKIWLPVRI